MLCKEFFQISKEDKSKISVLLELEVVRTS